MPKFSLKRNENKCLMPHMLIAAFLFAATLFAGGCRERQEDTFTLETLAAVGPAVEAELLVKETDASERGAVAAEEMEVYTESSLEDCVVHICGAVRTPGVYELPAGSRIVDALEAAGGFLPEADQTACNLADFLTDGSQIYILTMEEAAALREKQEPGGTVSAGGALVSDSAVSGTDDVSKDASSADGLVNINTAGRAELMTLPGIGESRAEAIIAWREQNGNFSDIEDIMKVSGIKEAAFAKIKDKIRT